MLSYYKVDTGVSRKRVGLLRALKFLLVSHVFRPFRRINKSGLHSPESGPSPIVLEAPECGI